MNPLSSPLTIRGISLPNRIWFPPVARDLALPDGTATAEHVAHYQRIASGGAGTVVVEHSFIHTDGRYSAKQLGADTDDKVPALSKIAGAIRTRGAVPVLQVSFAGARTSAARKVAPSAGPLPGETDPAEELSLQAIQSIPDLFEAAVRRAKEAGFSGAEIHGAHGFLLSEFFSPLINRRTDDYGGSLRARARLALEVVESAKRHASDSFLIVFRLGADDGMPGGLVPEEAAQIGTWLVAAGVDILSISGGLCGSRPGQQAPKQGYFFPQASIVRKAAKVPVVGVGGITDAEAAKAGVRDELVDLVAVGRTLLKDPEWARKACAE